MNIQVQSQLSAKTQEKIEEVAVTNTYLRGCCCWWWWASKHTWREREG